MISGEIDAAGDLATGALLGRAFEPSAGAGRGAHGACLNCGTALIGEHCHACGQAGHVHRSLGAIGHDLAHGVFHFEGKVWRTLPMLVFRPGELTRRYIHGERARFVSPLAMFLFTVFLMFAVVGLLTPSDFTGTKGGLAEVNAGMNEGRVEVEQRLAKLITGRVAAVAAGRDTTAIDTEISQRRIDLKAFDRASALASGSIVKSDAKSGWKRLDKGLEKAASNPGLIAYKVQSSAYKFSWALILLSIPFVALIFAWRRRFHMYDHAVFVTYSITFMSLLAIVLAITLALDLHQAISASMVTLVPPIHIYKQLRGTYGLRRFSALWRTIALTVFAVMALVTFVLGLIMLGLLG